MPGNNRSGCSFRSPLKCSLLYKDLPNVVLYKQSILSKLDWTPNCGLKIIGADLLKLRECKDFMSYFIPSIFNVICKPLSWCLIILAKPTLWILEGVIMYLDASEVRALLSSIYTLSAPTSKIILHTVNACEVQPEGIVFHCKKCIYSGC